MTEKRKFALTWECRAEAESLDEALELTRAAMTDIERRPELHRWVAREVGSPLERVVDQRPRKDPHSQPLGTVLRKEK